MPITTYTPEVKLSQMASIKRVCSHCKKPWTEMVKIEATAKGDESWLGPPDEKEFRKVKAKANQNLKDSMESEQKQVKCHVLCPSCNHFSIDAMAKHFPKGYQEGLKRKYIKALWSAFFLILLCGLGAVLLGGGVLSASSQEWKDAWFLLTPAAILALLLVWGSLHNLVNGTRVLFGINLVTKYLQAESDENLLNLAVSHYRKNEDSLGGFMCWAKMLLNHSKSK